MQPCDHVRDPPDVPFAAVHDRGIGRGLREPHRSPPRERVVLGSDEHAARCEHEDELEIRRRDIHRTEDEVHLVGAKPLQPLATRSRPHVHPGAGVPVPEPLEVLGHHVGGGGPPGRNPELLRDLSPILLSEGVGKAVHARHYRHGHPEEPVADRGKGNARTLPLEEGHSEIVLQRAHQLGDGRLAQEDVLGRPRDALESGRVTESAELLQPVAPGEGRSVFWHDGNDLLQEQIFSI